MDDLFAAVSLTAVAAFVIATGIVIIGIRMSEKGIGISTRNIKKAQGQAVNCGGINSRPFLCNYRIDWGYLRLHSQPKSIRTLI